jgi:hypothetical protein
MWLIALLLLIDGPDRTFREPRDPVYSLDRLSVEEAERLDGKTITCYVQLATSSTEYTPWFVYEGRTFDEVQRTVYFREEPQDETKLLTVKGKLRLFRHQSRIIQGFGFEGFVELKLRITNSPLQPGMSTVK